MTEPNRRRRTLPWAVLGALLLAGAALWLGLTVVGRDEPVAPTAGAGSQSEEQASGTGEGAGDAGGAPGPSDGGSSGDQAAPPVEVGFDPSRPRPATEPAEAPMPTDGARPELEPAEPAAVVHAPGDVSVSLVRVESVTGQATAGGEIGGPALRATVSIVNSGDDALDLEYVVVNTYWGDERVPAGTVMQPGGAPFHGSLAPGEEAEGVYIFSVAEEDRGDVVITVDHQAGEPVVVFRGDLT